LDLGHILERLIDFWPLSGPAFALLIILAVREIQDLRREPTEEERERVVKMQDGMLRSAAEILDEDGEIIIPEVMDEDGQVIIPEVEDWIREQKQKKEREKE